MDSGKRASMREGPLAALFRRTEEEGVEEQRKPPARSKEEHKPVTGRPFPADESPEVEEHVDELRPAPPSARAHAEPSARPARSPEQRLREVFSTDILESIMKRDQVRKREKDPGSYGGDEATAAAVPAPVLQPVLRVIGVGGA